jgi:import inner membrane translocase subunit TIM9
MSGLPAGGVDISNLDTSQVKTFRDFLSNYNRVSEMCFRACIWDFTSRSIKEKETRCTTACVEKYLKTNQRVSQRFQEMQMTQNEHLLSHQ